ncbi:UDP-N-acetylmuramate dehydrogenase [Gorillibacterium massiliense]|uniref:UDP-N-acetylmuramate dehydrogenase n=1 Tax=Gorillibacterium massiliense TaxID=1280390 RepID=UPI0004B550A7|nr:FAD-binding protein [Gorillibacterium massiliense]
MNKNEIFATRVSRNVPLSQHSSYEIGGNAPYFAQPETPEELQQLLAACKERDLQPFLFGMGTNLLFPDQPGDNTLYITLKKIDQCRLSDGNRLFVGAGMPLSLLALSGYQAGIPDYEFTHLLPGTLGAGVYINAKYGEGQMNRILHTVYYLDMSEADPEVRSLPAEECGFAYKTSVFQQHPWLIVGTELAATGKDQTVFAELSDMLVRWRKWGGGSALPSFYDFIMEEVRELTKNGQSLPKRMEDIHQYRVAKKHFEFPSCGSVFKNNYDFGRPVGALVDELELKGLAYGGAVISPYHGNMILNVNHAAAADVLYLIRQVQDAVNKSYGFVPEPEVGIVST